MPGRVLIVDDDRAFVRSLERALRGAGHDVSSGMSAADARARVRAVDPDVVVLDWQLPDADGLELLDELLPEARGAAFLMATAYPAVDVAVDAMKRGAFDYIAKGSDLQQYLLAVERGARFAQARKRAADVSGQGGAHHGLLGNSGAMQRLQARIAALQEADDTTVFIVGETGTGKGVIARAIHTASKRAYEPFVAVDCTTIPTTLWESELFGYEKGSFSGATGTKPGRVEQAGRGTLFLDEIGELDLPIQAKLLRLLEEREFTRVGSTRSRELAARIVTATNRNLDAAVSAGRFRADLRFRLEVFVVEVPPLRERDDDVMLLAHHFATERFRALGRSEPSLHPELVAALQRYPFPGNVRELRNMVEQAVLLTSGEELRLADFPVLQRFERGEAAASTGTFLRPGEPREPDLRPGARGPGDRDRPGPPQPPWPAQPGRWRGHRAPEDAGPAWPAAEPPPPPPGAPAPAGPPAAEPPQLPGSRAEARRVAEDREKQAIQRALLDSGGNVAGAARALGLTRYQLHRRLKKYGLH